mmetsp:Transcript_145680/g.206334  ORF Transcript_145680/g.206334 Transcript_145680/m.206334 type:complete len:220 (-) Transcript_145680:99-758(-)
MKFVSCALTLLFAPVVNAGNGRLSFRSGVFRADGTRERRLHEPVKINRERDLVSVARDAPKTTTAAAGEEGAIYVQDVYPNSDEEADSDEREDCEDDSKFFSVKLKIKIDDGGEDNAVYLVKQTDDDELRFVLSAPAMSLDNKKDYGTFNFCLEADDDVEYHLDCSNVDDKGWDGELKLTVIYKDDKIVWEPDDDDFRYQWASWDKNGGYDNSESVSFE